MKVTTRVRIVITLRDRSRLGILGLWQCFISSTRRSLQKFLLYNNSWSCIFRSSAWLCIIFPSKIFKHKKYIYSHLALVLHLPRRIEICQTFYQRFTKTYIINLSLWGIWSWNFRYQEVATSYLSVDLITHPKFAHVIFHVILFYFFHRPTY